ncbi:DUF4192 domain-containing protein [Isoptericola sp. NPDC057653]|uniref:DUF4192 domain-containing protein n=1 Tax=Isoptericola sp. NPDC057653 TaxID=3346195 RepID=UPI00369E9166
MEAVYATPHAGEPGSPFDLPVVLRSSRDLLAAVPYLLGFRPRECCVVVCVTTEGRIGLVARTSLTDADGVARADGPGPDARTVARAAARAGAAFVLVVLCTARPEAAVLRHAVDVLAALDEVLDVAADVETWLMGADGYRGLGCSDPACCPPGGRPLGELEHGEVGAAFVVAGRAVAASEQEAHRIVRAPVAVRDRAAKAAGRAERARPTALDGEAAGVSTARWRSEAYGVWRDLVRQAADERRAAVPGGETVLPPARLGRLAAALADVSVRDAVLLSLVPGGADVADLTAGGAEDEAAVEVATARAIARVVDPRVGVPPDPATADAARLVLEQVVGAAPRRWHAAPLALLGFLAWWRGDGWLASRRVREALRQDPSHRLAALLAGVLRAAVPPGWVASSGGRVPSDATGPATGLVTGPATGLVTGLVTGPATGVVGGPVTGLDVG